MAVLTAAFPAWPLSAQDGDFLQLQRRMVEIFRENRNAVVRVKAAFQETGETGDPKVTVKYGTGFFISRQGHLLTNASRTYGADRVWIEQDDLAYACEPVGHDLATNLALLRVLQLPENFTFLRLPESDVTPEIGSMAIVISCPLEFDPSPTFGLVSGHESRFFQQVFPTTYIRTNISAGLGEGGAPLIDLNGNLIGVIVAGLADIEGSYSVPARAARRVRDDLLFSGEVTYGWIGFEVTEEVSLAEGSLVEISRVNTGGPAERAGLLQGDTILRMGEFEVDRIADVRDAIFYSREGQFVDVTIRRDGEAITLPVRMARRPESEPYFRELRPESAGSTAAGQDGGTGPFPDAPAGDPSATSGTPESAVPQSGKGG